jgi:hypothetical protein
VFDYYRTFIDKSKVRDMNITKHKLMSLFIYIISELHLPINKRNMCMDSCIHQQFKDNWMKRWFVVLDMHFE